MIKSLIVSVIGVVMVLTIAPLAFAAGATDDINAICSQSQNSTSELCQGYKEGSTSPDNDNPIIKIIRAVINIMLYAAGALAVFFVMFGGFKYITSAGDPQKAASGRQTILYALVGLVVVIIAVPLVSWAFDKLT